MEVFGIVGMTFGLMAWIQVQGLNKEVAELKKTLDEMDRSGIDPREILGNSGLIREAGCPVSQSRYLPALIAKNSAYREAWDFIEWSEG